VLGLAALYIMMQLARQRRMLRFANMELLESVAPKRPSRWRHVPAILLVLALLLFTIAMAGPTHDVRIPRNRAVVMLVIDVSQSMRATDVEPNRMAAVISGPVIMHTYLVAHVASSTISELTLWSSAPPEVPWPSMADDPVLDSITAPLCDAYIASCP